MTAQDPENTPGPLEVLAEAERTVRERGRAALCQVVRVEGSTTGKVGWKLLVRPDGSVRVLRTQGEVFKDASGRAVRLVGSCWDVTELAEGTSAREHLLSLLRATIEATADGTLVVDRNRNGIIDTIEKSLPTS